MARLVSAFAQTGASTDGGTSPLYYVILVAFLALVTVIVKWIFARRATTAMKGAVGDASSARAIRIAPAPPLPEDLGRVRALLGVTSPAPRISRYSVPVVTTSARSLTIKDDKLGDLASIPFEDISTIEACVAKITPKGTLVPRAYPSLRITLRRGTDEVAATLTPVTGAYGKVHLSKVESMAAALRSRLATTHVE